MKKIIRIFLLLVFGFLFAFSVWQLWNIYSGYRVGEDSYDQLEQYVSASEPEDADDAAQSTVIPREDISVAELPDISAWPQIDFTQLAEINDDVVGWISIDGTNINYPIVQGTDNEYYMDHLFDGTYNSAGCIFMDYRCAYDFSDRHSIIYGHHMKNKSMFAGLLSYEDQAFYDAHSVALLVTPDAYYKIQFFSGYITDNWSNSWKLGLDDAEHTQWLEEVKERSCFASIHFPTAAEEVITLSTCAYDFDGAKFVLHGYISEKIEKLIFQ